jgi:hypothetical protein
MRFYKEVWGITWEFNSIGEYAGFIFGRILGVIIFIGLMYLLLTFVGSGEESTPESDYEVIPASVYEY